MSVFIKRIKVTTYKYTHKHTKPIPANKKKFFFLKKKKKKIHGHSLSFFYPFLFQA
jgi:hypothetical protein